EPNGVEHAAAELRDARRGMTTTRLRRDRFRDHAAESVQVDDASHLAPEARGPSGEEHRVLEGRAEQRDLAHGRSAGRTGARDAGGFGRAPATLAPPVSGSSAGPRGPGRGGAVSTSSPTLRSARSMPSICASESSEAPYAGLVSPCRARVYGEVGYAESSTGTSESAFVA